MALNVIQMCQWKIQFDVEEQKKKQVKHKYRDCYILIIFKNRELTFILTPYLSLFRNETRKNKNLNGKSVLQFVRSFELNRIRKE